MKLFRKTALLATATLAFATAQTGAALAIPNPILHYAGKVNYVAGGQNWTRYQIAVLNRAQFPNALFAPAPKLPPCGLNKNSARTWVDIFNVVGHARLYGFCALHSNADLGSLWFAAPQGQPHATHVYVVMTDRATHLHYQSAPITIP